MLPKDLLKYARKFTPEEIRQAIMKAINGTKNNVRDYVDEYMAKLHEIQAAKRMAELATPWVQPPTTNIPNSGWGVAPYTTTDARGSAWTGGYTANSNTITSSNYFGSASSQWSYTL